jgi:hypothetical protein
MRLVSADASPQRGAIREPSAVGTSAFRSAMITRCAPSAEPAAGVDILDTALTKA